MSESRLTAAPRAVEHTAVPVLLNANAGKLHLRAGSDELVRIAAAHGVRIDVIGTETPAEMRERLIELRNRATSRVAVAGGDGTVHVAAQVLAESNTALGIVPQGTANNFATALRLPMDLPSALQVLVEGVIRPVDLGFVGGEYFTESAGVGLFADALALYGGGNKNIWRALRAIFRLVFSLHAHRIRLTVDGRSIAERAVMCTAANSYRMGFAVPIAPDAKVTDAELDVVIIGDLHRNELLSTFRAIRAQLHQNLPKVKTLRGREIKIESRRPMAVHCDDRIIGKTPVQIAVRPGALKVLIERL